MSDEISEEKRAYLEAVVTTYKSDPALREKNRQAEEEAVRAYDETADNPANDGAEAGEGEIET